MITIEEFIKYERALSRSENTLYNYKLDIEQFIRYATGNKPTTETAQKYAEKMADDGLSAASRARKLSALNSFFEYGKRHGEVDENPFADIGKPKIPTKEPRPLTDGDVKKLIRAVETDTDIGQPYFRNITIIHLFLSTGLRRNELINVELSDVDLRTCSILVREGKGNKQRTVYYGESTRALLSEWICSHRAEYCTAGDSDYLFVSKRSGKMSSSMINNIVNRAMERAEIADKGYTVHSLRRTFATAVYNATKDIVAVQMLLGHTNPQTTMHYVGINEDSKRNAAQAINF